MGRNARSDWNNHTPQHNANVSLQQDHEDALLRGAHYVWSNGNDKTIQLLLITKMMDRENDDTNKACLETGNLTVAVSIP